jgi:hypothetical protein
VRAPSHIGAAEAMRPRRRRRPAGSPARRSTFDGRNGARRPGTDDRLVRSYWPVETTPRPCEMDETTGLVPVRRPSQQVGHRCERSLKQPPTAVWSGRIRGEATRVTATCGASGSGEAGGRKACCGGRRRGEAGRRNPVVERNRTRSYRSKAILQQAKATRTADNAASLAPARNDASVEDVSVESNPVLTRHRFGGPPSEATL